jgi:hypothetical protein
MWPLTKYYPTLKLRCLTLNSAARILILILCKLRDRHISSMSLFSTGSVGQFGQSNQPGQNQLNQQNTSIFSNPGTPNSSILVGSQSQNSPSIFQSSQNANYANQNINNTLGHSQSMMNLNTVSPNSPALPGWTRSERRIVPNHVSSLRHKSSFSTTTPDRHSGLNTSTGLHRHLSVSGGAPGSKSNNANSPPETRFGQMSSFGTPKPLHARRADVIDESDLPPPDSIYDSGALPFFNKRPSDSPSAANNSQQSYGLFSSTSGLTGESTPPSANPSGGTLVRTPSATNSRRLSSNYVSAPLPSPVRAVTPGPANSVIIFGFPSAVTNAVINHFSKFGEILENMGSATSPAKANSRQDTPLPVQAGKNWLRITYKNPQSALRALNENGKALGGQFLIGCVPYSSKGLEGGIGRNALQSADESLEIDLDGLDEEAPPQVSIRNTSLIEEAPASDDRPVAITNNKEKVVPRTISMPLLAAGSKRLEVKDGHSVFTHPKGRGLRFAPSLANIAAAATAPSNDKKQKLGKQGWLSWTTKRAQEFVFGWDDL